VRIAGRSSGTVIPKTNAQASDGNRSTDRTIAHYGVQQKGPLTDKVASTFRSGAYTMKMTTQPMTLYRAHTEGASKLGNFWTREKPEGPTQAKMDSALNPKWGNNATTYSTIRVPAGTRFFEGKVAPQQIARGGELHGGGSQIVFSKPVPESWLK
jgi:hypothetical protein